MTVTAMYGAGFLGENPFIITDEATGKSAVIDPSFSAGAESFPLDSLEYILLTHGHFDHVSHALDLRRRTGAKILALRDEAPVLLRPELNLSGMFGDTLSLTLDKALYDGEEILLGETVIKVLHTPGHTAGSGCFLVQGHLFTGDTVMAGSAGRTDFPTGDAVLLGRSIRRLSVLEGNYVLHCGHGPDTDLLTEKRQNPFFTEEF